MSVPRPYFLILIVLIFCKTLLPVCGYGICAGNGHVDLQLNKFYKSFIRIEIIGVLQCVKVCKRYKLCNKIHHDREQLTCDLLMTFAEKGNVTSLMDKDSLQIGNLGCSHCSETDVCINMTVQFPRCIKQDECPSADWETFNHKCYFFQTDPFTADKSLEFCSAKNNGTLVRIDNAEVSEFIISGMELFGMGYVWLAANDREEEGKYVWGPGDEVLNPNWADDEPGIHAEVYDCVCMSLLLKKWRVFSCTETPASIMCQVPFVLPTI